MTGRERVEGCCLCERTGEEGEALFATEHSAHAQTFQIAWAPADRLLEIGKRESCCTFALIMSGTFMIRRCESWHLT